MLKNYFITAFRSFWRNKAFTAINVLGLSIGISAALVIFLIVYYEFSYDTFEQNKERIYRVVLDATFNGTEGHSAAVPAPLSNAIEHEVTGVELTVPVMQFQGDATAKVSIQRIDKNNQLVFKKQPDIVFTSPQYFTLLSYHWIAGSPRVSMQQPFNVVLTESRAKLYFPSLSATGIIGKQINYNDDITATITGIVKDLNETTAFSAVEFISYSTIAQTHLQEQFMMNVWNDWMAYSQLYIKLTKGSSAAHTERQLKALLNKYNKDANKDAANTMGYHLQPLGDVHFNHLYPGIGQRLADKSSLYSLLVIATFLLLLGCINFINLTTANAAQRAKEIGIRKTMGSSRMQLVIQFMGETFLLTSIAAFSSFCLTPLLLQLFTDFIPHGLVFAPLHQPYILVFLLLLIALVSFLAGLYPSLILSGYKPVNVLKSQSLISNNETRHAWVRKTLTVFQFVVAQFFVIATMMVGKQINFALHADLGFNKNGIITFETPHDTVAARTQQLLNTINAIPDVEIASTGFLSPADAGVAFTNVSYSPKPDVKANVQIRWGDPNYINVYKLKLLAGRNVALSDTMREFLINDTYAKLLGFTTPKAAIGKSLTFNNKSMPIVGVMEDFHDQSMHASISPIVFAGAKGSTFHIRLQANSAGGENWQHAITKIQKAYHQAYPGEDFSYHFFDDTIASMYATELRTAQLLSWATGLAILISCLGLLGLVMFTIHTRTKEIGIRKILGATVAHIVSILSKDFVQLVVIAFVIAAPLAWWATYRWLQDFAYRTAMSWWVFLVSGSAMLGIALLTLGIHTIKAATSNPIKSLRVE